MSKKSKIADNTSAKEIIEQMNALESFETLYRLIPFSKKLFPNLDSAFSDFSKLKEQARIFLVPDQFNEAFSSHGWIAYESMSFEIEYENSIRCIKKTSKSYRVERVGGNNETDRK